MNAFRRELRVMMVAHYFPPDGGPGAQRPIAFARHLPAFGVRTTVLSRSTPLVRGAFDPADPAGLERVAPWCRIVRAGTSGVTTAGDRAEWVRAGLAAAAEERPDVVLATLSPFELWRVAAAIGERLDVPVVLDLRDPWALDGVQVWRSRWHWLLARREMRGALERVDGVVANTPECGRLFRDLAPRLRRLTVIPNGWDRDDFPRDGRTREPGATMTLLHAGTFLCNELYPAGGRIRGLLRRLRYRPEPIDVAGRTPRHLLEAIRYLRAYGEPAGREVELVTVGQADAALVRCVEESGVASACRVRPYAPHADLVETIRTADALFLTLHGLPSGARSRIVPGKTYEYLASGRPILAALPAGDARDLVATSPRAFLAEPNAASLAAQLRALHAAWRAGAFRRAEVPPGFDRFERRRLSGALAAFLREVSGMGDRAAAPLASTKERGRSSALEVREPVNEARDTGSRCSRRPPSRLL